MKKTGEWIEKATTTELQAALSGATLIWKQNKGQLGAKDVTTVASKNQMLAIRKALQSR